MRFTINSGTARRTFHQPIHADRDTQRDQRRSMAQEIKNALFPGVSYRNAKARGAAALAVA